jgi:hypothetical protein
VCRAHCRRIKKKDGVSEGSPHWSDAVILFSDVIQSAAGYVTGCAWADWLNETVRIAPSSAPRPLLTFATLHGDSHKDTRASVALSRCPYRPWQATVLGQPPVASVIVTNLFIVLLLTAGSCYWLIMNTSSDGIEDSLDMTEEEKKAKAEALATDRGEVEKAFFSGALGFFVLGGWLTVVRNLFAPFSVLMEMGVEYADDKFGFT